ncbi:tagaturonate reductase [Cecembia rubra]|uniref:Tagaturonate reductase n=1 Tax=Cecembia rubra TaxID=1485585 RepID=A0A2P8EDZ0_9BACT|nr:tagaturonate reductase [Cecembia rubra]PSL07681.1 tagaturonate reductase [Cecembia rubra]
MNTLNKKSLNFPSRPIKIIQFGGGNFLRGFVDWMVDLMNEKTDFCGNIQIVKPLSQGSVEKFNSQDGLFHVLIQGLENGKIIQNTRLISCVEGLINPYMNYDGFLALSENPNLQFVISNTTEVGITFDPNDSFQENACPISFPGKLTAFLFHRFRFFNENTYKGLNILPCELIEKNGDQLRNCVLQYAEYWNLPMNFVLWIKESCNFYNTLVDRIVPGYPKDNIREIHEKLGFEDQFMVTAEPYHLWVIEGPEGLENVFPASQAGLQVKFVKDLSPYRTQKVRILNGSHTAMAPMAYILGLKTVREAVDDKDFGKIVKSMIFDEIIPSIDLPQEELKRFASDVLDRFSNPFIHHELISISLNSISKFRVRVLPSIFEFQHKNGFWPHYLTRSLAALILFYSGRINGENIPLKDEAYVLEFFEMVWQEADLEKIIKYSLQNEAFWGIDLSQFSGFAELVLIELQQLIGLNKSKTI